MNIEKHYYMTKFLGVRVGDPHLLLIHIPHMMHTHKYVANLLYLFREIQC